MRILKVTQSYYPFLERGGPAVKIRAIAQALVRGGHEVTILTADLGFGKTPERARTVHRNLWGWRDVQEGVEAVYLPVRARYRALTVNPGVLGFCRAELASFDLAHIYGLYDLLGPPVASRCLRQGLPFVVEPMGMFRPIVRSLWLKRAYHGLFGERMLRQARRIIATSEQERAELVEGGLPASKIIVRRNGVELPAELPARGMFRRRFGIPENAKLVLYLGRLVPKKSPELLLEAFARWHEQAGCASTAVLVLAGPDEGDGYREKLLHLVKSLGLQPTVLFPGPLYEADKWAAYRDADVFVLPSQNENFGNAAAEAIACGTPVILTDRCGIAPLLAGRAGIVVPYSREALQAGLARVLENEDQHRHLRAECAEAALALGWDEPLAQLEALYAALLREVGSR